MRLRCSCNDAGAARSALYAVLPRDDVRLAASGILTHAGGASGSYLASWWCGATCGADFNHDSSLDFFGYLDVVDAFSAGAVGADFDGDGAIAQGCG